MKQLVVIPKRVRTFARCLQAMLEMPDRCLFQSELKRVAYSSASWHDVVRPEFDFWDEVIKTEFPGYSLTQRENTRNPRTCKTNEILYRLHPAVDVIARSKYFIVVLNGGEAE